MKVTFIVVMQLEAAAPLAWQGPLAVGHGSKSIRDDHISQSRALFYRGHKNNMVVFVKDVSVNFDRFYVVLFCFNV